VRARTARVAALAVALLLVGLIGLVAVFDGPDTYRDIARDSNVNGAAFHAPPDLVWYVDLGTLVQVHERTLRYVLGDAPALPTFATTDRPLFDDNERSHMADVRSLFGATKVAFVVGLLLAVAILRWSPGARLGLARDAAVIAGIAVTAIAALAAIAFDPLFLLFHEVFFPQGNFLFPPDSNLITLYPDPYWYGVTLRIGLTFIVAMGVIAIAATATRRRSRR
jgi:integral membrane protein (TIGR01906 family)